jgi:lipoprotein signal peptidase
MIAVFAIILAVVCADQASKVWIVQNFEPVSEVSRSSTVCSI